MYGFRQKREKRTTLIDRYSASLGQLVDHRRAELALRVAKDNAEAAALAAQSASRAKTEFLAKMSHEIRTPMNGVLGMTDLLSRTELSDRQRKFVGTAHHSAETLLNLINDILDYSRIETGKVELEHIDFDVFSTVGNVIDLLAESAQSKGLEITYNFSRTVPQWLHGDANRLRQIVLNLVSNGIKFTDRGEVSVRVDAEQEAAGSVVLSCEVTDTGIGVPPEAQERILRPFEQADGSITRRFGGAGLGLTITRQLIEMMGGDLSIDSTPGKGSTFRFTVCLDPPTAAHHQDVVPQSELAGTKVLIVDDNVTNREILHYYVSEWGMTAEAAADGPRALQMLHVAVNCGEPFDLVLLDMMMPGMSGVQVAKMIRTEPAFAGIRLIVLTSMGRCSDSEELSPSHIQAYLTKPVRQSELCQQIARVVSTPLEQAVLPERSADAEPEPAGGEHKGEHKMDAGVLLAEDNPVNQEVMREYLLNLGCRVDLVATGLQAVTASEHKPYDLILMDCQMPDMDGFEATTLLRLRERQQNASRRIPIIAVTANAFEHERENCLAAGMDDYISKPFSQNDLSVMLRRWLKPDGAADADGSDGDARARPRRVESSNLEVLRRHEAFDPKALNNIAALNHGTSNDNVDEIIRIYLDVTPTYLVKLREAIAAGDALCAERMAHNLKSSSATLGAMKLAAKCRELEQLAHEKILDDASLHFAQIESSFEEVREIFTASVVAQEQRRRHG